MIVAIAGLKNLKERGKKKKNALSSRVQIHSDGEIRFFFFFFLLIGVKAEDLGWKVDFSP